MKFDIIGDIHGCYEELLTLIHKLGYELKHGLPVHPDKRTLALVGDLTDRGPQSVDVMLCHSCLLTWRDPLRTWQSLL